MVTREATTAAAPAAAHGEQKVAFAAFRDGNFRNYLVTNVLFMIGDNVEHVVSYWVLFYLFQSPVLAGYAVISHWMPSLLFSVYAGSLADRYDCRRLLQISMLMFAGCSVAWGILIATDSLQVWQSLLILTIHGFAVVLRGPAGQLIIHDIVGGQNLQSAIRLNATGIQLGLVGGPAVGGAMIVFFGPAIGLLLNSLLYIPQITWLSLVPFTGHRSDAARTRQPRIGIGDLARVMREVSRNRTIFAMLVLTGAGALFIGSGIQAQMPEFARDLGEDKAGLGYTILQMATAVGAILGGLALEGGNLLRPHARTAIIAGVLFGITVIGFAAAPTLAIAIPLLFCMGAFRLAFSSMAQTLVQILAPANLRGRTLGVFAMAQSGLQTGSGATVGLLGAAVGIHWSLGLSGLAVLIATVWLLQFVRSGLDQPLAATA